MLCYLRLHVELALRAKGMLMLRESGFEEPPLDDETRAQIEELRLSRAQPRPDRSTRAAPVGGGDRQGPLAAEVAGTVRAGR